MARRITCLGMLPVMMKPPIPTLICRDRRYGVAVADGVPPGVDVGDGVPPGVDVGDAAGVAVGDGVPPGVGVGTGPPFPRSYTSSKPTPVPLFRPASNAV